MVSVPPVGIEVDATVVGEVAVFELELEQAAAKMATGTSNAAKRRVGPILRFTHVSHCPADEETS